MTIDFEKLSAGFDPDNRERAEAFLNGFVLNYAAARARDPRLPDLSPENVEGLCLATMCGLRVMTGIINAAMKKAEAAGNSAGLGAAAEAAIACTLAAAVGAVNGFVLSLDLQASTGAALLLRACLQVQPAVNDLTVAEVRRLLAMSREAQP